MALEAQGDAFSGNTGALQGNTGLQQTLGQEVKCKQSRYGQEERLCTPVIKVQQWGSNATALTGWWGMSKAGQQAELVIYNHDTSTAPSLGSSSSLSGQQKGKETTRDSVAVMGLV